MNRGSRTARALASLVWLTVRATAEDPTAPPERPRVFLETGVASTPVTGATIPVAAGGDFQAALNDANPGDEIVLEAGATYTGNFTLPAKDGRGRWITVRTSDMAGLPDEGTRAVPRHAKAMARIVDPDGDGAISTALGAGYYRLIGLEVTVSPEVKDAWALVKLGSGDSSQDSPEVVAHHLILDRVYLHGDPAQNCFRCVALNSAHSAVIDSYLADGHAQGFDAQAIGGWNGPGPYKIVNNHLEGSGENVMFGGADPHIPDLVPADIEFRRNRCFKPLRWKVGDRGYAGIPWTVKNLFELKNARRVLIEGNVFENNWAHAQNGTAILFTVRNQDGKAPWSVVEDVTMTGNVLRNAPTAFVILGEDSPNQSRQSRRFLIRDNLFDGIERTAFMITAGAEDVEIDHNTFLPTDYSALVMSGLGGRDASGAVIGKPCRRFKLTNNILGFGLYGPCVDGGQNTFAEAFPGMTWDRNLFVGHGEGRAGSAADNEAYPAGCLFEFRRTGDGGYGDADWAAVGFIDPAGGDYRLGPGSAYRGRATDGKDLGADADAIGAALRHGPLAAVPSRPGPHIERIQALADDSWLELGSPDADPTWGRARGRSWTSEMPVAPELRGAFLHGEGRHGYTKPDGRYMDDLWFYDINAHRWICCYPGTPARTVRLILDDDGFEATPAGDRVPVAQQVHGYEMNVYDTEGKRLMSMPNTHPYWEGAMPQRKGWLEPPPPDASPWLFDVAAGKWNRLRTGTTGPRSGYGDTFIHLPGRNQAFFLHGNDEAWIYDTRANAWRRVDPGGPRPPFGIDAVSCYDSRRDRIYIGGGSYPVAPPGTGAFWAYDLMTHTWLDLAPTGSPCKGSNSYPTKNAVLVYDPWNDRVLLVFHSFHDDRPERLGVWVYDPNANSWADEPRAVPEKLGHDGQAKNGFYDPRLNAVFIHSAGDSRDDGTVWAYRYRRAPG